MAELHRRAAAGSSRLSPEEITNRGFASAFRGVSETEVRNFLKRVADELVDARNQEADLQRQIDDLKEQLRNPTPVTEQQLLDSLGEETARVLRSAQEAAEEIRSRAEERGAALVKEAQDDATKRREETQKHVAARTEATEQKVKELEEQAESRATALREGAQRDADALRELTTQETDAVREQAAAEAANEIETAKATSRTLVDEARTVRERVLADLGRRRSLLQAQVDELRSGRDRLLDAYRVVKRTLSDATNALAQVEARANTELAGPAPRVTVPPVEGELEAIQGAPDAGSGPAPHVEAGIDIDLDEVVLDEEHAEDAAAAAPPAAAGSPSGDAPDADSGAAVDALFARLRASHTVDPVPGAAAPAADAADAPAAEVSETSEAPTPEDEPAAPAASAPDPVVAAPDASEATTVEPEPEPDAEAAPAVEVVEPEAAPDPEPEPEAEPLSPDDVLRVERAEVLEPLAKDLARRAKRALQDQQNELLDRIRTVKGKVQAAEVLPSVEDQEAVWRPVLDEPLSLAYAKAFSDLAPGDSGGGEVPRDLLEGIAHTMVEPWRQRLVSAIDGASDDPDAVTERLGARYREYRGAELEDALGDALAAAWASGTYAAAPKGMLLRWVPAEVGRCPDCDDNALEPTARSEPFPTGQLLPPAHQGCRCFLAPAETAPAKR